MRRTTYILIGMYLFGMIMMIVGIATMVNKLEMYNENTYEMSVPAQPENQDDTDSEFFQ